jgi:hypothetical protein
VTTVKRSWAISFFTAFEWVGAVVTFCLSICEMSGLDLVLDDFSVFPQSLSSVISHLSEFLVAHRSCFLFAILYQLVKNRNWSVKDTGASNLHNLNMNWTTGVWIHRGRGTTALCST